MIETDYEAEIVRVARDLTEGHADWVTFYRATLGPQGLVRQYYPSQEKLAEFEQTEAYAEIQQILRDLRQRATPPECTVEPTAVITVRLPQSLHRALKAEAHEHETSMNKLCISKLLQIIDPGLVPTDSRTAPLIQSNPVEQVPSDPEP